MEGLIPLLENSLVTRTVYNFDHKQKDMQGYYHAFRLMRVLGPYSSVSTFYQSFSHGYL